MRRFWPKALGLVVLSLALLAGGYAAGCGAGGTGAEDGAEDAAESGAAEGTDDTAGDAEGPEAGGDDSGAAGDRAGVAAERPNIVFVMTDDMDEGMMREMPVVRRRMAGMGVSFDNAVVTNSLCCPSRATFLRGQYSHNHHITSNDLPDGGAERFRELDLDQSTFATWLDGAGYRTGLVGKYMNNLERGYAPPGWDEWYGMTGMAKDRKLNENGSVRHYEGVRHMTDVYKRLSLDFLERATDGEDEPPFMLWVGTSAPHLPANYAARHVGMHRNAEQPRPASFNEADVSDKPEWLRKLSRLSPRRVRTLQGEHRDRLRSNESVDQMMGEILTLLREEEELRDTYVVFTTDNGLQRGEHRLQKKSVPYEESMGVPLVIRGPGVPRGATREQLAANNDLAPTFASWAGAPVPGFVDGRSLAPLLKKEPPEAGVWRTAILNERDQYERAVIPDYEAVRTGDHTYVEWETGEEELYDLSRDPHQLRSIHETADPALLDALRARLDALRGCRGAGCRTAENPQPAG